MTVSRSMPACDALDAAPAPAEQVETLAKELQVGSVLPISESLHQGLIRNRARFEPEICVFSPSAGAFARIGGVGRLLDAKVKGSC